MSSLLATSRDTFWRAPAAEPEMASTCRSGQGRGAGAGRQGRGRGHVVSGRLVMCVVWLDESKGSRIECVLQVMCPAPLTAPLLPAPPSQPPMLPLHPLHSPPRCPCTPFTAPLLPLHPHLRSQQLHQARYAVRVAYDLDGRSIGRQVVDGPHSSGEHLWAGPGRARGAEERGGEGRGSAPRAS